MEDVQKFQWKLQPPTSQTKERYGAVSTNDVIYITSPRVSLSTFSYAGIALIQFSPHSTQHNIKGRNINMKGYFFISSSVLFRPICNFLCSIMRSSFSSSNFNSSTSLWRFIIFVAISACSLSTETGFLSRCFAPLHKECAHQISAWTKISYTALLPSFYLHLCFSEDSIALFHSTEKDSLRLDAFSNTTNSNKRGIAKVPT